MKKLIIPFLLILLLPATYSCSNAKRLGYILTEGDAAAGIREMLVKGLNDGSFTGAFQKDNILKTLFPDDVAKLLNTMNQLGLTTEIDRFTTTMSTAAEKTATQAVPIFVSGVNKLSFTDAIRLVKAGGTAGTDYLRSSVGDSLRRAITPTMKQALDEYKLIEQWNNLIKPVKAIAGNRLNLDLPTLMAGMVSEAMFRKMAEKEIEVRNNASARTTKLLQNVFSRNWN